MQRTTQAEVTDDFAKKSGRSGIDYTHENTVVHIATQQYAAVC